MGKKSGLPTKWEKKLNAESKEMFGKPVNRLNYAQIDQLVERRKHGAFWTPGL